MDLPGEPMTLPQYVVQLLQQSQVQETHPSSRVDPWPGQSSPQLFEQHTSDKRRATESPVG